MITKEDFWKLDDRYYVADIIDVDGDGWVTETELNEILKIVNNEHTAV